MRQVLAYAAMAIFAAVITPKLVEHIGERKAAPQPAAMSANSSAPAAPTPYSSRSVTIAPDRQGHFRVEARIDYRRLDFMIDTGASVIALTARDADRVGIRPMPSAYTTSVKTANGSVNAAPATLRAIEIEGITVYDVPALVLPDDALSENLLGLSFLSRLRRFEYANGKLVLEQ